MAEKHPLPSRNFGAFLLLSLLFFSSEFVSRAQSPELVEKSRRAAELMRTGKFQQAVPLFQNLVRALPQNPGLRMNLGLAFHMSGRLKEAIPQFQTVLKLEPQNLTADLFLGSAYLGVGESGRAAAHLRKAVRAQPGNVEARDMLAQALVGLRRFTEAAPHLETLAELNPNSPRVWYALGLCYEELAGQAFEELENLAPESAYWLALVAASRSERQTGSAFFFYRQALSKLATLRGVHTALAAIYRKTGHEDWAAVEEEKEKKLPPPDCRIEKLECAFREGHLRELIQSARSGKSETAESYYWRTQAYNELARQSFARLETLPTSAERHELMAGIHTNQGRHLEAVAEWRQALKHSPGNPYLLTELAVSLHNGRDHQDAQLLLEELLEREPQSSRLNHLMGDTLLSLQQPEKAIPYLEKAVQNNSSLLGAHASLGRAYLQTGQARQAIPHLKAALPQDGDGTLHYQLARAYQSSGQRELAREILGKSQQMRQSAAAERKTVEEELQITPP